MTPSGIEPATFRFVAQPLNHCATAVTDNAQGKVVCCTKCNTGEDVFMNLIYFFYRSLASSYAPKQTLDHC